MTSTTSDSQELSGFLSEVHNSWSPVTFSRLATYYLCKWLQAIACPKNLLRSIHTWKILKVWRDRPLQAWCLLLGFILKRDTLCFWRAGFPSACSPQIMGASSWLQIPSNLFFNPVGSPRALSGSMSLGVSEFWTWPLHVCDSCVGFNPGQFQEHVWSQAPCNSLTLRRSLCQELSSVQVTHNPQLILIEVILHLATVGGSGYHMRQSAASSAQDLNKKERSCFCKNEAIPGHSFCDATHHHTP